MPNETVLVVEDDPNIARLLQFSLAGQGYQVLVATRGEQALEICREQAVNIIVLDIRLPGISGYEVGEALRLSPQTEQIPIIVLTAFTERQDKLDAYRKIRAEHFLGKPFDIEELSSVLRIHLDGAARRAQQHPITELPTGELVNGRLRNLISREAWTLAYMRVNGFESFTQRYGSIAGENALKSAAQLLQDALREHGRASDFIGQLGIGPSFVLIADHPEIDAVIDALVAGFDEEIKTHYDYHDRRRGYLELTAGDEVRRHPLMSLTIAGLSAADGPFRDIRELTEAAERMLQEAANSGSSQIVRRP